MRLTLDNLCTSAVQAIKETLINVSDINIAEIPEIRKTDIAKAVITSSEDTFTSIIALEFSESGRTINGALVLYISHGNLKPLFGRFGITSISPKADKIEICRSFCKETARHLKEALEGLGCRDVSVSDPSNYSRRVEISLEIEVSHVHTIGFTNKGEGLLTADVFLEEL